MIQNKWIRGFEGWHIEPEFYGDAILAEATLIPQKKDFYLGIGVNIEFEGNYQLRITDKTYENTGCYTLFLVKRTTAMMTLTQCSFRPEEYEVAMNRPISLRLEYEAGCLKGYLNQQLLLTYDDSQSGERFETGYCGVWIHPERAAIIEDFHSEGKAKEKPEKKQREVTEQFYEMNLCDATKEGKLPYWSTDPKWSEWIVKEDCYQNPKDCLSSMTHLHVFESDPSVNMQMQFSDLGEDASCGVLLRHAPLTAYVKVGYDHQKKCWFIEDVPALYDCKIQRFESKTIAIDSSQVYQLKIRLCKKEATLVVDGNVMIYATGLRQVGFGRVGFFTKNMTMQVQAFRVELPYATEMLDGVVKTFVDENHYAASTEIEVAPDGNLIGITKALLQEPDAPYHTGIYHSTDEGLTFQRIQAGEDYSALDTKAKYQSVAKLKSGKYLQVRLVDDLSVQESTDLIHWEDVGKICVSEKYGDCNKIFHTSSLVEYEDSKGRTRIFMPIAMSKQVIMPGSNLRTRMHDTVVYYSDDGGKTWRASQNSTVQVFEEVGHPEMLTYAECKVVRCKDGSLRLYNTRNDSRFVCYSESFDFGETWSGLYTIKEMQCAKSSSAFCEDLTEPGTFYAAWVNDEPIARGNMNGRTRISLARSRDGKTWSYLGDGEYMSLRFADEMQHLYIPLFQILDPSITVTEKYVYLTYGISMQSAKEAMPGDLKMVHHIQRPALVRFEKAKLQEQPWSDRNICNMELFFHSEEDVL